MKTSELTGAALDWAVAKCEGYRLDLVPEDSYTPSTDWVQGGPIIEREGINLFQRKGLAAKEGKPWLAYTASQLEQAGPTPLIAAMRCYVASKLGDEVDVPDELK